MLKGKPLLAAMFETEDPEICQIRLYKADEADTFQYVASRTINGAESASDSRKLAFMHNSDFLMAAWLKGTLAGSGFLLDDSLSTLMSMAGASYSRSNIPIEGEPNTIFDGLYYYISTLPYPQSYLRITYQNGINFSVFGMGDNSQYSDLTEPQSGSNGERALFGGSVLPPVGGSTTEDCPIFIDGDARQYYVGILSEDNGKISNLWSSPKALPLPSATVKSILRSSHNVFIVASGNALNFIEFDRVTETFGFSYSLTMAGPITSAILSHNKRLLAVGFNDAGIYKTRFYSLNGGYATEVLFLEESNIGKLLSWTGNDEYFIDLGSEKALKTEVINRNLVITDASHIVAGIPIPVAQACSIHNQNTSLHGYVYNSGNKSVIAGEVDTDNLRIYFLTEDATFFTTDTINEVTNNGGYIVEGNGIPAGGILLENADFVVDSRTSFFKLKADNISLITTANKTVGQMLLFDATNSIPIALYDFSSPVIFQTGGKVVIDVSELLILE